MDRDLQVRVPTSDTVGSLRNNLGSFPPATIAMWTIEEALGFVVGELSDKNYARSLAFYRFWFETGGDYLEIPPDPIFNAIWNHRGEGSSIYHDYGQIFHASAHLILRFASDAESDHVLAPHSSDLQSRLCARSLREFTSNNLMVARYGNDTVASFYADVNFVAHWANLGYVEESAIRNHILQSLISHPILYRHQAFALIILFKLAGATFEHTLTHRWSTAASSSSRSTPLVISRTRIKERSYRCVCSTYRRVIIGLR